MLYTPVFLCEDGVIMLPPGVNPDKYQFDTCEEYYDNVADSMRDRSFLITYGYIGIIAATMIGNMLLFYGFNIASEKMNKRVRDAAFKSLVRQEVGYFDVHPVAILTSRMADDAALLHSFSGEPIRTLIMNIASVLVGLGKFFFFGECMALFCNTDCGCSSISGVICIHVAFRSRYSVSCLCIPVEWGLRRLCRTVV